MPHKICPVYEELHAKETAETLAGRPVHRPHENICCCMCKHHCQLSSHPWVNKQSGKLGWVCIHHCEDTKYAMLCNEHFVGGCEMYDYDDRGD